MANDLLKDEYFCLQRIVEDFDSKSLDIKKWSVGVVSASAFASLATPTSNAGLIAGSIAAVGFWITDASWKTFQQGFLPRLKEIEAAYSRGMEDQLKPLQISASWRREVGPTAVVVNTFKHMLWPNVFVPHVVVLVIAILAVALQHR